jgi:hypothetical protein
MGFWSRLEVWFLPLAAALFICLRRWSLAFFIDLRGAFFCALTALAFPCFLSLTVSRIFRATAAMNGADVALVAVRAGYATS